MTENGRLIKRTLAQGNKLCRCCYFLFDFPVLVCKEGHGCKVENPIQRPPYQALCLQPAVLVWVVDRCDVVAVACAKDGDLSSLKQLHAGHARSEIHGCTRTAVAFHAS